MLLKTTVLAHMDPSVTLNIAVGASDFAIREVMQQSVSEIWQPLGFLS